MRAARRREIDIVVVARLDRLARPDHVVLPHPTLSLDGVQRLATLASEAGVPLLDAGVSGRQGATTAWAICA